MSANNSNTENKTDDLDLINLLEKIFLFFRAYGRLIAIFSVLGILAGFVLYKASPKTYRSTLLLHSYMLSNTEHINIIEDWNALLKDKSYSTLARRLNCTQGTLRQVISIKAAEIQKLYIPNNPNGFMVEVYVKNNAVIDSLTGMIVYGLENSDYIKAKLSSRRSTLLQLINEVKGEITKLDSTKKNIENSINSNNQHTSSFIVDISSINSQMIGLNEKSLSYQDELKFCNAVQVLHPFEKFEKPASPKLLKLLLLGFIGGFALGYIFSLYLYLRKRMVHVVASE